MSHSAPIQTAPNPLLHLPSVLSLSDLHRRVHRVLDQMKVGEDEIVALLSIDPLALLRGLRAANSYVFQQETTLPTVRGIVRALGPTLLNRIFHRPPVDVAGARELKMLWRHSVATAMAARELANRTGMLEPDVAYMAGLLHDLPAWLKLLGEAQGRPTRPPVDWILQWRLPAPFVSLILAIDMGDRPTSMSEPPDPAALIRAAELLAHLAGYHHPHDQDRDWYEKVMASTDKSERMFAQKLTRLVDGALRTFGIADDITDEEVDTAVIPTTWEPPRHSIDDVVVNVMGCMQSDTYRGVITALTASALRHGNYDSVYYAKWHDDRAMLTLRTKADLSARRMHRRQLQVSAEEAVALRGALVTRVPAHIRPSGGRSEGLLDLLSADELLAVPLNNTFHLPAFLLLDRSLTLQPHVPERDMTLPTMLAMTGSLLIENLLLRLRRQRAQKFALTDPLTHLFNRRMGIHSLEQAIAATERERRPLTVLMCDLDHFKRLNDTLGHIKGDAALRATADVLRHTLRRSDTVCRYGGEEFLVVLPDTTPDKATVLATRLFTSVHARGEELGLPLTISIGLTSHRSGDTVESLLVRADRALYASKDYGRNRFSVDFDNDHEELGRTPEPPPKPT